MGGHCQYGVYDTIHEVYVAWLEYERKYTEIYNLTLAEANISYREENSKKRFFLSMRFTK